MPRAALGTWKAPAEKTKEAVLTAVRAGYRFIDCANDYDNEHVIGEALQQLFAEGTVKREELFIQVMYLWIIIFHNVGFLSSYNFIDIV